MEIDLLVSKPQHIEDVAEMVYKEFVVPTSSKKTYEEVVEFFKRTYVDEFPITFIASVDGQCVGTVSVFENDWKERPQFKPWLASLFVEPSYRSQKIGFYLIKALLEYMKKIGYTKVFLKTENAAVYYEKRGWERIETVLDEQGDHIDIFKYTLLNVESNY
ncbi:GNAT family N-acetyltransferase [Lysinibacillus sp. NPDC093692]|uniref:GNAT family N-acetyltransferase n=1 Tax=Lysinibacillus sp. NPDC093692 TaxID=3390578 RepID=UPI003D03B9D7